MGELVCGDGWDLEAVVRGYVSPASSATRDITESFGSFTDDPDLMSRTKRDPGFPLDFPGFCEMAMLLDVDSSGVHNLSMLSASLQATEVGSQGNTVEVNGEGKLQGGAGSSFVVAAPAGIDAICTTAKYKRRKNQQKPVVRHVTADGISSDPWAWRKYSQKPIKGSPFPRSYYRCSSSKGCTARKQIERSTSDPGMFTMTYTGEHSHGHPTRRSALSGITRSSKFSKKPTAMTSVDEFIHAPRLPQEITAGHSNGSSPTSTASVEEGECDRRGAPVWGESGNDGNVLQLPRSLVLGEEIFVGFDEVEAFGVDFALINCC